MASRRIYVGSLGAHLYDDADAIGDPDGYFVGRTQYAIATDGAVLAHDIEADEIVINMLISKGIAVGIKTINGDYIISAYDEALILVDTDDGDIILTLPLISAIPGRVFYIKNIGTKRNGAFLQGLSGELVERESLQKLHDSDAADVIAGPLMWRFI